MIDFGQIVDKVSNLFGDSNEFKDGVAGQIGELLGGQSFDASMLENLSVDQLGELLSQAGIDPSTIADGQLLETAQQLFADGGIENIDLSQWLGSDKTS